MDLLLTMEGEMVSGGGGGGREGDKLVIGEKEMSLDPRARGEECSAIEIEQIPALHFAAAGEQTSKGK